MSRGSYSSECDAGVLMILPFVIAGSIMLIFMFADGMGCEWTQKLKYKAEQRQQTEVVVIIKED